MCILLPFSARGSILFCPIREIVLDNRWEEEKTPRTTEHYTNLHLAAVCECRQSCKVCVPLVRWLVTFHACFAPSALETSIKLLLPLEL